MCVAIGTMSTHLSCSDRSPCSGQSRLAGDEFTIVLKGLNSVAEAELVAGKVVASFNTPVQVGGVPYAVSTSIGIAFSTSVSTDVETLTHQADTALYKAKSSGRGQFAVFRPEVAGNRAELGGNRISA